MSINRAALYREYRIKLKYEILLVSFLVLIFGDVFFENDVNAAPFLIIQNVLASMVLFYGKKKWRLPLLLIFLTISVLVVFDLLLGRTGYLRVIFALTYMVYFVFLSTEVFHRILRMKEVNLSSISAVLCGFIILGLIGGYVFSIIEVSQTGSFSNLSSGLDKFEDLIYFSFVTILSVGYGDISPVTPIAKKAAMFFGLLGYFYGVVVIGIMIGRFISERDNRTNKNS